MTNSCGNTTSNSISVTVNTTPTAPITPLGSTSFCTGGSVTLSANTGTGLGYQWKLNTVNINGATAYTYLATAAGSYTCVVTNACGSTTSNGIVVTVNAPPTASITAGGATTFCLGGSVQLSANTGAGLTHQWRLNGTPLTGATLPSYSATATGNYTCVVTNSCTSAVSNTIIVTVLTTPAVPAVINGQATGICGSTITYSTSPVTGASVYTWTVPPGCVINSGQGTTSLTVTYSIPFSSGTVSVTAGNTCGTSAASNLAVTAALTPTGAITGNSSPCSNARAIYSVPAVPGATNYTWTIPPKAKIMAGQGTNTIDLRLHQFGGNITVRPSNACTTGTVSVLPISIVVCLHNPHRALTLDATVYPNPSADAFTLKVYSGDETSCLLVVTDMTGRVVEKMENFLPGDEITFGSMLAPGLYSAEIRQGEERLVVRVVKAN